MSAVRTARGAAASGEPSQMSPRFWRARSGSAKPMAATVAGVHGTAPDTPRVPGSAKNSSNAVRTVRRVRS